MVNCPDATLAVLGSNITLRVADCPGVNVIGNAAPETAKPVPLMLAESIVNGAEPIEDSETD